MMVSNSPGDLERLLAAAPNDPQAEREVFSLVYDELTQIASRSRRLKGRDLSIGTTSLVHQAYLRLGRRRFNDLPHLLGAYGVAIRRSLLDRARARNTGKRGRNPERVPLDALNLGKTDKVHQTLVVTDILAKLKQSNPTAALVLHLRVECGLKVEEIASVLKTSECTVQRKLRSGKAWIRQTLHTSRSL